MPYARQPPPATPTLQSQVPRAWDPPARSSLAPGKGRARVALQGRAGQGKARQGKVHYALTNHELRPHGRDMPAGALQAAAQLAARSEEDSISLARTMYVPYVIPCLRQAACCLSPCSDTRYLRYSRTRALPDADARKRKRRLPARLLRMPPPAQRGTHVLPLPVCVCVRSRCGVCCGGESFCWAGARGRGMSVGVFWCSLIMG